MDKFYDVLKQRIADHQPNFGNGGSAIRGLQRMQAAGRDRSNIGFLLATEIK